MFSSGMHASNSAVTSFFNKLPINPMIKAFESMSEILLIFFICLENSVGKVGGFYSIRVILIRLPRSFPSLK